MVQRGKEASERAPLPAPPTPQQVVLCWAHEDGVSDRIIPVLAPLLSPGPGVQAHKRILSKDVLNLGVGSVPH